MKHTRPEITPNTLVDWLGYLEQLHPKTIDMGLDRVNKVRTELGLVPSFPVIIVGGTNGKGSVCAMLESILTTAGYNVGCYTSPHLIRYNERIRIQQKEVTDRELIQTFTLVDEARTNCCVSLTYFEFGTLTAMHLMIAKQIDVAILEVGLGGRLDAVNIFDADCAILTSIGLDHMEYLGHSRETIGYEKAGIFRANKPAVCSEQNLPFSIIQFAKKIGAQLFMIHQEFGFSRQITDDKDHWEFWCLKDQRYTLPLPALQGPHQLQNASACLAALDIMSERLPVGMQAIRQGMTNAILPGRFQIVSYHPLIILDVAHNPEAAHSLAANLEITKPIGKTYVVLSMLLDKDIPGVIQAIKQHVDIWLLSPIHSARGASTHDLLQHFYRLDIPGAKQTIYEFNDTVSAYRYACEHADNNDRICVLGSFYTVGAVLQYREKINNRQYLDI